MPTPYAPGAGSSMPVASHSRRRNVVGHLDEDAGAVTGQRIAAAGAAMREVAQDGEALLDDVVRALALDVRDEADAAGVALGPGS